MVGKWKLESRRIILRNFMRNYSFRPVASSSKDMQPEFFLSQCLSRSTIYFSADSHLQATKYVNFK